MVNYRLISLALTNRDIATIHSNIVQEYNTLKGYSWKWLGGVSVAFLVMFCVLGWGMKTILDRLVDKADDSIPAFVYITVRAHQ